MNLERLLKEKREEILRIAAKHGARNVRVFGSVARGEAGEGSDVDLLVEFEPGRSLLDQAILVADLEELGPHPRPTHHRQGLHRAAIARLWGTLLALSCRYD